MSSPRYSSSRSSTEMGQDKQYLLAEDIMSDGTLYARHASRKRNRFFNMNTALLAANVILLVAGLGVWIKVNSLLKGFSCGPREDVFEPDLLFDTRTTFQPHSYLGGRPKNDTNEAWRRLQPPGDGIVEIPNHLTGNLPPSLPAPNNKEHAKVYGVSMFHQLHCLNFLRYAYYPETVEDFPPDEVEFHRDHCLDYIRQGIMCAGDFTLEPLTEVGINGMGATHQCRSFERMFSWAYEHRSDKIHGSGYTGGKVTHSPDHRNDFDEGGESSSVHPHSHGHGGH
ncbi:hypothetical protein QBC37DRAFT_294967 [Rhypophila decipiens]|uniref:Oxidase ustYa n=1 Tax=Rhypophila decipiens TaxID=261697 RepID=A0AAN6Y4J6_9PEZI|nr:hypothetical protein QBC37DRAFT_294967 [Rhypophila decipiens]